MDNSTPRIVPPGILSGSGNSDDSATFVQSDWLLVANPLEISWNCDYSFRVRSEPRKW